MSIADDDQPSLWARPDLQSRRSVDLLCREFEDLWRNQQRVTIEAILPKAGSAIREELTRELIAIEWELRLQNGEAPTRTDYIPRFESVADLITELETQALSEKGSRAVGRAESRGLEPGTMFSSYRILRELGRGAMGIVYLAELPSIGHQVAIKILNSAYTDDPLIMTRFEREAQLLSRLDHPGIVPLYSYGEQNGLRYLVMKAIHGVSLAEVLFANGSVGTVSETLRDFKSPGRLELIQSIAIQLTDALRFVHQAGILHRDLKPSNVVVMESGKVFLSDFGLARTSRIDSELTSQHEFIGTLRYAAPESLDGFWSVQTDLYSLGLMMLELCSLVPSFSGRTRRELLQQRLDRNSLQQVVLASSVAPPLRRIVERLTKYYPEERYASAAEVLSELQNMNFNQSPGMPAVKSRTAAKIGIAVTGVALLILATFRSRQPADVGESASLDHGSSVVVPTQTETQEPTTSVFDTQKFSQKTVVPLELPGQANLLTISDQGNAVLLSAQGKLYRWNSGTSYAVEIEKRENARILMADISPHGDVVFSTEELPKDLGNGQMSGKLYGIAFNRPELGVMWSGFNIPMFDETFCNSQVVRGNTDSNRRIFLIPSLAAPATHDLVSGQFNRLPWNPGQLKMATAWGSSLIVVTFSEMWIQSDLDNPDPQAPAFSTDVKDSTSVHFLNDGQFLIVSSEEQFSLFSIASKEKLTTQQFPAGTRPVLSTPHQGVWLACAGKRNVHVFDAELNQWLPGVIETQNDLLLAAPIPSEKLILTVETSGRIRLTKMQPTGTHVIYETSTSPLTLAAYSTPSQCFAAIDTDSNLRVFQIEPP